MDDIPPPPYTETDIRSHSSRPPVTQPGVNDDDASVTTSSHGTTIYTPPETPRESHFNFPSNDDHHTTASAHSYFELRHTLRSATGENFVISLAITENASPEDFPYPDWAREHDTTEQDWQTFLNYLLPDHASRANSHVVERKLQAEDENSSSTTERSIAEAQLGQIKSSTNLAAQSSHDLDAMIHEWNDGFFGPRGVTIERTTPQPTSTSQEPGTQQTPPVEPQPQPQPQPQGQSSRSWWNPFRPFEANNRGIRMGGLTIDNDRVSFGDSFEVDRNGVRWGGQQSASPGTRGFPPGPDSFGSFPEGRGFGEHGTARGRRRWRQDHHSHHGHQGSRDRSRSSSSGASSSSDSDSSSSIGSIPNCDDLNDSQLPVAKQSIHSWLDHPEQPVTKKMLKALRSDIKAAKNAPPPVDDSASGFNREVTRQEVRQLLAKFKVLKREQKRKAKALRKEKRVQKKELKRERRERRRAEKRERRNVRHDVRSAEREMEGHPRRDPDEPRPFNPFRAADMPSFTMPSASAPHDPVVAPSFPFGRPGFPFGRGGRGRGGPFGGPHLRHWESHIRDAQQQAHQARSHARQQAELARINAQQQAEQARNLAHQQADRERTNAQAQASTARAEAQRVAEAAWAQAALATRAAIPPWGPTLRRAVLPTNDKLRAADSLDAQITGKAHSLRALREAMERERTEAAMRGGAAAAAAEEEEEEGEGSEDKKGSSKEMQAEALESEIERMQLEMERLRLEGLQLQTDEQLARTLQMHENQRIV
ncbi:uncharacterized protein F4812DRAFT_96832 [Daldinia caldariorum]|uniref:uncharacterized protein n=1 Tax=Daldinia caldariorum TaxID=326644 RepID=UPI002008CEED|nr:uncharacterized protein F4812DRAFT_96832 [Daldinia caldariorum]KAI1466091.1 hypothetical protein F4812DRAFT_96832 [Daldinia caldariorum]